MSHLHKSASQYGHLKTAPHKSIQVRQNVLFCYLLILIAIIIHANACYNSIWALFAYYLSIIFWLISDLSDYLLILCHFSYHENRFRLNLCRFIHHIYAIYQIYRFYQIYLIHRIYRIYRVSYVYQSIIYTSASFTIIMLVNAPQNGILVANVTAVRHQYAVIYSYETVKRSNTIVIWQQYRIV